MLVLSRRLDERILIGDDVVITVVGFMGDQVRLGIDAPRDLLIRRLRPDGSFEGNQGEWRREKPGKGVAK